MDGPKVFFLIEIAKYCHIFDYYYVIKVVNMNFAKACTLGVSPSLVSRYCEVYSFWGISGP